MPSLPPTSPALRRRQTMLKGLGWLISVSGALLAAAVPVFIILLARQVNAPTLPGHLPTYTGTRADTAYAFLLLGLLGVVGCLALANGTYLVRHLRQSRLLSKLLILGFGLLMFAVATGSAWLKNLGL